MYAERVTGTVEFTHINLIESVEEVGQYQRIRRCRDGGSWGENSVVILKKGRLPISRVVQHEERERQEICECG